MFVLFNKVSQLCITMFCYSYVMLYPKKMPDWITVLNIYPPF